MLLTILVAGNVACSSSFPSHTQWLAILATRSSLANAAIELEKLGGRTAGLELVSTEDCRNLRPNLFLVVAGVLGDQQSAIAASDLWRTKGVNDAYAKVCDVVEHSRLASGISLLDPSFDTLSTQPVNWDLDDAISRVESLGSGVLVSIIPYYEADPEDIREGLKIRVLLRRPAPKQPLSLSADCIDPELAANRNYLALSCVTESAADHLLHQTQVFNLDDGPSRSCLRQISRAAVSRRNIGLYEGNGGCRREAVFEGTAVLSSGKIKVLRTFPVVSSPAEKPAPQNASANTQRMVCTATPPVQKIPRNHPEPDTQAVPMVASLELAPAGARGSYIKDVRNCNAKCGCNCSDSALGFGSIRTQLFGLVFEIRIERGV